MHTSSSKPMPPKMKFFLSRIFPLIFIIAGGSVGFFGIRGVIRAKASTGWPTTQGKVIASSVDRQRSTGNGPSKITYHAKIQYEFSVHEKSFNGDRVAYGDYGSSNSSHARNIVSRYHKGKDVTVYYMPEDPFECLLEPGLKMQSWFLPGFGMIFLTVGIIMAIFLPILMKKQGMVKEDNA